MRLCLFVSLKRQRREINPQPRANPRYPANEKHPAPPACSNLLARVADS